jgi:ABC-type lipoprotein release transport system permease subunit
MILRDAVTLSSSKIKTRKLRTIVSTITISVLFGVVIAALLIINGLRSSLEESAKILSNGDIYLRASQNVSGFDDKEIINRAIELYKNSPDSDKQYPLVTSYPSGEALDEPYLDNNNIFAMQAAEEYREVIQTELEEAVAYKSHGYDISIMQMAEYSVRSDTMHIENNYTLANTGSTLLFLSQEVVQPLIQISLPTDETAIPVIVPIDIAGEIAGMGTISASATNEQRKEYITAVYDKAIGFTYTATLQSESVETEVQYQIVGLLPPFGSLKITQKSNEFNIINLILGNLGANAPPFIVVDTSSQLFHDTYTASNVYSFSVNYLLRFTDIQQASDFRTKYSCSITENHCHDFFVEEILNNHLNIQAVFGMVDGLLIIFIVFFSIVAVIIMASTLSRILNDESQSIALYRSMGASTRDIMQIYMIYIIMLCALACIAATIIGVALSGTATLLISSDLSSNIMYFYGVSRVANATLLMFDARILLVLLTIFIVGMLCFLLLLDKLTSRNIVKNLKS